MSNIVVLNPREHRDLTVDRRPSARLGDDKRFVQVVVQEFPYLAAQYPILLSKDPETGAFFCGAMLGFDEGENLFLDERGFEGYRPLNLQRAPFYYAAGDQLAVDMDSPRIGAMGGEALFTGEGAPSDYLKSVMGVFQVLRPGIVTTKSFIDTLLRLKLLTPMEVELSFDDASEIRLQDLYTINQVTLQDLPDAEVLDLFRSGSLYLIDLMIASVKHIATLARRKNSRLSGAAPGLGLG
jgi:hypothetical protein